MNDYDIEVNCMFCGAYLHFPKSVLGTTVTCWKCKKEIQLLKQVDYAESDKASAEIAKELNS